MRICYYDVTPGYVPARGTAYVANDPVNGTDPTGMDCEFWGSCPPGHGNRPEDSINCGAAGMCSVQDQEAIRQQYIADGGRFLTHEETLELAESARAQGELMLGFATGGPIANQGRKEIGKRIIARRIFNNRRRNIRTAIDSQFNRGLENGLADAIRREVTTGELVGGVSHLQKGRDALRFVARQRRQINNSHSLTRSQRDKLLKPLNEFEDQVRAAQNAAN